MAKAHGGELGEAVKFVLDHPALMTTLTGPLRSAFTETTLHFGGPTDRASYEKLLDDPNPGRQRHARRMIEAIDQGRPIRNDYPYAVQALALGDQLTMVALSGEVVVDYAIRLQKELGGEGRALWVAAYANDVVGYIPSLRVLKEGGLRGGRVVLRQHLARSAGRRCRVDRRQGGAPNDRESPESLRYAGRSRSCRAPGSCRWRWRSPQAVPRGEKPRGRPDRGAS